jgi:DNA polymerase-1
MKTLLLIDAHALIHRFFHALPPLSTPEGKPIQAIYGLSGALLKFRNSLNPDFGAAAFDRPEETFRKKEFKDYKVHRPQATNELIEQFNEARRTFAAFGITVFEKPGFEADDILGTLASALSREKDLLIVILSGDLDILQLVRDTHTVADIVSGGISNIVRYSEKEVLDRYGLPPKLLIDYKGLVGDASDNIPGVPGIGPKTAKELITEWGSLEGVFENLPLVKSRIAEKLSLNKENAFLSKRLATIDCRVPIEIPPLETLRMPQLRSQDIKTYLEKLGFQSLLERIARQ